MVGKRPRPDRESDPIAELARLIAHADTHEESAPSDNQFPASHVETPELPPAPDLAVDLGDDDQSCEHDEHCSEDQACGVDDDLFAAEQEYQDSEFARDPIEEGRQDGEIPDYPVEGEHEGYEVSRVRRHKLTLPPLPSRPVVMRFKLRRSAVKVGLKPRFARCKRDTPTS
jgi:hypothetical protein